MSFFFIFNSEYILNRKWRFDNDPVPDPNPDTVPNPAPNPDPNADPYPAPATNSALICRNSHN